MNERRVPRIFSQRRRAERDRRSQRLGADPDAASWLLDEMRSDIAERIAFMKLEPDSSALIGQGFGGFAESLGGAVSHFPSLDEEQPLPGGPYDFIGSIARLDTVNDLPGALLHARAALNDGGVFIATMLGAGSLPVLRGVLLAADAERPAARIHPQIDNRAATSLLERAAFARQVVDRSAVRASYRDLDRLVADLREQGLTNVLADAPPPLTRAAWARANAAFDAMKDQEGRVTETFEILTLTGWR